MRREIRKPESLIRWLKNKTLPQDQELTNKASWRIFAGIKTCSRKKNQNGELDMRRRKLDSKNKALTRHGPNVGDYSPHGEGDDGRIERWALQNRAARHIRGS
jgi:hypothetical protein